MKSWRLSQSLSRGAAMFVAAGCALALVVVGMALPAGADQGVWAINLSYSGGLGSRRVPKRIGLLCGRAASVDLEKRSLYLAHPDRSNELVAGAFVSSCVDLFQRW